MSKIFSAFKVLVIGLGLLISSQALAYHFYMAQTLSVEEGANSSASLPSSAPSPEPSSSPSPAEFIPEEAENNDLGYHFDPEEPRRVVKEIKRDFLPQVKQLRKKAQKMNLGDAVAGLDQLSSKANQILAVLANSSASNQAIRENLDLWYRGEEEDDETNPWNLLNRKWRSRIELPSEIKDAFKGLKRLEKLIASKAAKKGAQNLGLNLDGVQQYITEVRQTFQTLNDLIAAGNYEEAAEQKRELVDEEQRPHWGEVEGATHELARGMNDTLRGIKDQNVISQVKALLQPAINAYNASDFREVHEVMNDVRDDIMRLVNDARRRPRKAVPASASAYRNLFRR